MSHPLAPRWVDWFWISLLYFQFNSTDFLLNFRILDTCMFKSGTAAITWTFFNRPLVSDSPCLPPYRDEAGQVRGDSSCRPPCWPTAIPNPAPLPPPPHRFWAMSPLNSIDILLFVLFYTDFLTTGFCILSVFSSPFTFLPICTPWFYWRSPIIHPTVVHFPTLKITD